MSSQHRVGLLILDLFLIEEWCQVLISMSECAFILPYPSHRKEAVYKMRVRRLEAQTNQGRERINSQSLDLTLDIQSKSHVILGRTIWKVTTKV